MKKYYLTVVAGIAALGMLVSCTGSNKSGEQVSASDEAEVSVSDAGVVRQIDTLNSYLTWKGFKPGGEHFGKLPIARGEVSVQDDKLLAGSVVFQMNAIVVEDIEGEAAANLKAHLENADFFEVEAYPEARFELTNLGAEGVALYALSELKGNLTLKGVTKNVTIPIAAVQVDGAQTMIQSKTFRINRTDWKVEYGSKSIFKNLGDKFIDDEIELSFKLVF